MANQAKVWAGAAALVAAGLALCFEAGCEQAREQAAAPASAPTASAAKPAVATPVTFDVYGGYFVSNKFEPKAEASFAVLQGQPAFDRVFGAAYVMRDKSHRLPPDAFDSKIVLAAIHRGKAVWEYQVQDVQASGRVVTVRYAATSKASDSAEFACPLILAVDRGGYEAAEFVENGRPVKKVEMAQPAGRPEAPGK
jgi:hypothetical protein